MPHDTSLQRELGRAGRVWLRGAVADPDLSDLDTAASLQSKAGQRLESSAALRRALAPDSALLTAIRRIDPAAYPVRVVGFNKTDGTNWGVPWHQDRVIAVADRADCDGYGNWTRKAGVWHCEPPQQVLDAMLFVRVHLDDTGAENGAMQIATGSHRYGIVPAKSAETTALSCPVEVCTAKRGDVLILKMLTLHCSKPSTAPGNRRVLRIDFASSSLSHPLRWTKPDEGG